jgi:hypothetical protein
MLAINADTAAPRTPLLGLLSRGKLRGKQQLISVGIDDLDHVVTPPGLLARNRALDDFTANPARFAM